MDSHCYEFEARRAGYSGVAGVDEAGRGPLAGPVVAAAVILPQDIVLDGVRDSKKLSERARREAFSLIKKGAIGISLAVVDPQAVLRLDPQPDCLLIDGIHPIDLPIHQRCIIKGDQLCLSISAASILAKVYRDSIMHSYHKLYPQYGFSSNKGYGTSGHREAIAKHGPCCIHRVTFRGVLT